MRIGDTRSDILLPVGSHELELRSRLLVTQTVNVTVAKGEKRVVQVKMRPKPATLSFPKTLAPNCTVTANGADIGTTEALGWSWTVERPDEALDVLVQCPDGYTRANHWNNLPSPEVQFPAN
jgi:hypothetical protein